MKPRRVEACIPIKPLTGDISICNRIENIKIFKKIFILSNYLSIVNTCYFSLELF